LGARRWLARPLTTVAPISLRLSQLTVSVRRPPDYRDEAGRSFSDLEPTP